MSDWLQKHSQQGYGEAYDATLSQGYWGAHWEYLERPALRAQLEQCRARGATVLLDLACGTGRVLSLANEVFPNSIGADASSAMLQQAARRGYPVVECDATALSFARSIDVVTAFRFMLNAPPELRQAVLRSVRSVLRNGGWFISNIHVNAKSPAGLAYRLFNLATNHGALRVLSLQEYTQVLRAEGFAVELVLWHGTLPRICKELDSISSRLLVPADRLARAFRIPVQWSQSFMVVARTA